LEKTFSSLSDALFLIDAKTVRIIDCNKAASRIFGYSKEEILGQAPGVIFQDASTFDEYSQPIQAGAGGTDRLGRFETWMRRKDGSIFPTETSITPLIDVQNGHIGWVSLVHDATVRKRAEQLLIKAKDELEQRVAERTAEVQRTSKQLRELVAHSPAVIYSACLDGDFCVSFVSENVLALTGYGANCFKENVNFWGNVIHPDDLARVLAEIDKVRKSGGAVFEYRIIPKEGGYRWVRDEMKLVKDADGNAHEFVGSWVDITNQKLAEFALQEFEATNRVMLNSTTASFSLIDPDGKLLSINEAGANFLGRKVKDLLGLCIYDLFPPELAKSRKTRIETVCKTGRPVHYEDMRAGYCFDNNLYPVFDENGKVTRVVIHATNITESKKIQESLIQSEERYRTLADASPDMIFIIDREDDVQYVNSFASKFIHLPVEEIIGQPRSRFFASATSDHQKKNIDKVLEDGQPLYAEDQTRTPERSIWLGTWLVPLKDSSGVISGVLGVSRDITVQKQAELEIRQARDQLEERVKARTAELISSQNQLRQLTSQLVSAQEEERRRISRELHDEAGQAIISLKYNLASMMSEIPASHDSARERVSDSIQISDQLMEQIRTLTRSLRPPVLEIGGINLSLKVYCEEITERTGLDIDYQGVEIPNLPDEIGISLYRFVQEALTNILKHAHATRVSIKLQYQKKVITLSVADNGRGLIDGGPSDGIGLLGLEERFNLFDGKIKLSSHKGRGVKVVASLPWPKPADPAGQ
jgi:PAS domain S-box-containing protein